MLAEMEARKDIESLVKVLLKNKDRKIRGMAAKALGMIKDKRAVEPLIQLLKDDEPGIQAMARWALAEIGDAIGFDVVENSILAQDKSLFAQWRAARIVKEKMGDNIAPPDLSLYFRVRER